MKEFDIQGKLVLDDELDHQAFLHKFYTILKAYGIHFSGSTKQIVKEDERSIE